MTQSQGGGSGDRGRNHSSEEVDLEEPPSLAKDQLESDVSVAVTSFADHGCAGLGTIGEFSGGLRLPCFIELLILHFTVLTRYFLFADPSAIIYASLSFSFSDI